MAAGQSNFKAKLFRQIAASKVQSAEGTHCVIGNQNRRATYLHKVWIEEGLYRAFIDAEKLERVLSLRDVNLTSVIESGIIRNHPLSSECPGIPQSKTHARYSELGVLPQWQRLMDENKHLFVSWLFEAIKTYRAEVAETQPKGKSSRKRPGPRPKNRPASCTRGYR